jgi:RNA polymerase sigma factor (sigma-70 family)
MSIGITRVSVIQRARRGDADEFARIYAPLAFAMARKFGLSEADAGDVSQQVILELLQLLPTFEYDRGKGSFKGLVKKIVRNRAADMLRRRMPPGDESVLERALHANGSPDEVFEREWYKAHLVAALERVRAEVQPTTLQSFQLAVLCEWPIEQVAETLGLSANQVSQNKRRVFARLKEHLAELEYDLL